MKYQSLIQIIAPNESFEETIQSGSYLYSHAEEGFQIDCQEDEQGRLTSIYVECETEEKEPLQQEEWQLLLQKWQRGLQPYISPAYPQQVAAIEESGYVTLEWKHEQCEGREVEVEEPTATFRPDGQLIDFYNVVSPIEFLEGEPSELPDNWKDQVMERIQLQRCWEQQDERIYEKGDDLFHLVYAFNHLSIEQVDENEFLVEQFDLLEPMTPEEHKAAQQLSQLYPNRVFICQSIEEEGGSHLFNVYEEIAGNAVTAIGFVEITRCTGHLTRLSVTPLIDSSFAPLTQPLLDEAIILEIIRESLQQKIIWKDTFEGDETIRLTKDRVFYMDRPIIDAQTGEGWPLKTAKPLEEGMYESNAND